MTPANSMPLPMAKTLAPDLTLGPACLTRSPPPILSTDLSPIDLTIPLTMEVI